MNKLMSVVDKVIDFSISQMGGKNSLMEAARVDKALLEIILSEGLDMSVKLDNGNNILHVACLDNNFEVVEYLLSHGLADLESRGEKGWTPIWIAVGIDQVRLFHLLVSKGCKLSVVDDSGNNILHLACGTGNTHIVNYLLSQDSVNKNARDQYGRTPVMIAAEIALEDIFLLLVKKGCDLSVVDENGCNILHLACIGDNINIVENVLFHNVVDKESVDGYGRTPIMVAAESGSKRVLNLLLNEDCDLSKADTDNRHFIHLACSWYAHIFFVDRLLSKRQTDIESKGQYGRTPIMVAAEKGQTNMFEFLVSKGCSLSLVDDTGNNILHVSCITGNIDIIKYLLSSASVSIDDKGICGRTAVMMTAYHGHLNVFELLVSKHCDLSIADNKGNNILHLASLGGNVGIVRYVLTRKETDIESRGESGRTAIMMAAQNGHKHVFDLLVNEECNMSIVDNEGDNILHTSSLGDSVEIVQYILDHRVVDIDSKGQCGRTAVMKAAERGQKNVFNLLVSNGCDMLAIDDKGKTVLHFACLAGNVGIVQCIVKHSRADMEKKCEYGTTAVMMAAQYGQKKVFDLLVREGCDMSAVDNTGNNILHFACIGGNPDIIEHILSESGSDAASKNQYGMTPQEVAHCCGHERVVALLQKTLALL